MNFTSKLNNLKRKIMKKITFLLVVLFITAFIKAQPGGGEEPGGGNDGNDDGGASTTYDFKTDIEGLWQYESSEDIYYIVGLYYCSNPAEESYEQMGIFVPGAYMNATENSDGTYTCTIDSTATVNGYAASTAPVVIPVNTPGYSAQSAPSGYSSDIATYTGEGFVYLWAGCRGRSHGAPLGITDLKAAVKYFRYLQAEQEAVPGSAERIFSFGHSGGGAQSAIFGTSGNSDLYDDYFTAIGAETEYEDDIYGSMCWCPITNLDLGDAAYEWNMGLTRSSLSDADSSISAGLAAEFANYVNAVGFIHPTTGDTLKLSSTSDGYYQSGSYYEYILEEVNDAIERYNSYNSASISTYTTTDESALSSFASNYKTATKGIGAFDDYNDMGTAENTLFGIAGTEGHFDPYLAELVNTYASSYYSEFTSDLSSTNVDSIGNTVQERVMIYTPLYYLVDNDTYYSGGGSGSSDVAKHWRIRTGIEQGDAALNTEINLALGLENYDGVESVDFETIWAQGHTEAEDSGDASTNFIEWVEEKCPVSISTTSAIKSTIDADNLVEAYSYGKVIYIKGELSGYNATLISVNGTTVETYKLTNDGLTTIDQSSIKDGVYFLQINNGSDFYNFKLIL